MIRALFWGVDAERILSMPLTGYQVDDLLLGIKQKLSLSQFKRLIMLNGSISLVQKLDELMYKEAWK
jgi:hypothetical protein